MSEEKKWDGFYDNWRDISDPELRLVVFGAFYDAVLAKAMTSHPKAQPEITEADSLVEDNRSVIVDTKAATALEE